MHRRERSSLVRKSSSSKSSGIESSLKTKQNTQKIENFPKRLVAELLLFGVWADLDSDHVNELDL